MGGCSDGDRIVTGSWYVPRVFLCVFWCRWFAVDVSRSVLRAFPYCLAYPLRAVGMSLECGNPHVSRAFFSKPCMCLERFTFLRWWRMSGVSCRCCLVAYAKQQMAAYAKQQMAAYAKQHRAAVVWRHMPSLTTGRVAAMGGRHRLGRFLA